MDNNELFTTPCALTPKASGRKRTRTLSEQDIDAVGVGLTHQEAERLKEIAGELGVKRNGLLLWIVRYFMRQYEAGYRPPTETKTITALKD